MALISILCLGAAMKARSGVTLVATLMLSVAFAGCAGWGDDGPSTVLVNRYMMPEEQLPGDLRWVSGGAEPPGPQPMKPARLAQIRDTMNSNDPPEGIISTPRDGWSVFTAPNGDQSEGGASQLVMRLASLDDARAYYDYTVRKFVEQRIGCTSILDVPSAFRLGDVVVEVYGTKGYGPLLAGAVAQLQDFDQEWRAEDHVCPKQDPPLQYSIDDEEDTITVLSTNYSMRWDQTTIRAEVPAGSLFYFLEDDEPHAASNDLRVVNTTKEALEAGDVLAFCMEPPEGDEEAQNFTGEAEVFVTFLAAPQGKPPIRYEMVHTFEDVRSC